MEVIFRNFVYKKIYCKYLQARWVRFKSYCVSFKSEWVSFRSRGFHWPSDLLVSFLDGDPHPPAADLLVRLREHVLLVLQPANQGKFIKFVGKEYRGVYLFLKNMNFWLAGEKIWWFTKKKRKYKGEEEENGELFTILGEKNIILEKHQLFG